MARRRLLVVEDDPGIRRGIVDALDYSGFEVLESSSGCEGLEKALRLEFELLLLDLVLPGKDGFEILAEVRRSRPTLPVIVLTARGEESDRVAGLRLGADDYVVKPFSIKELIARVEAVLRRSPERPEPLRELSLGGMSINLARRELAFADGERRALSERESELLRYLIANAGRAISRDEILSRVWRLEPFGLETRTIDMHIARLREKLRDSPSSPRVLLTVRGKGYMFATPGAQRP